MRRKTRDEIIRVGQDALDKRQATIDSQSAHIQTLESCLLRLSRAVVAEAHHPGESETEETNAALADAERLHRVRWGGQSTQEGESNE